MDYSKIGTMVADNGNNRTILTTNEINDCASNRSTNAEATRLQPTSKALASVLFDKELVFIKTKNWDERKKHHELKFDMILNVAADYITRTKGKELLKTFIETVKLDTGSADEMPSWTLGLFHHHQGKKKEHHQFHHLLNLKVLRSKNQGNLNLINYEQG